MVRGRQTGMAALAGVLALLLGLPASWAQPEPPLLPGVGAAPTLPGGAVPGQLLVQYQTGVPVPRAEAALARRGMQVIRDLGFEGWRVVSFDPRRDMISEAAALRVDPAVARAEPNYRRRIFFEPNDPCYRGYDRFAVPPACADTGAGVLFGPQWNFARVQAAQAWDLSRGNGVLVAVLDTGYSAGNDGAVSIVTGYNAITGGSDTTDDQGHGTHVSNTIVERTDNGLGMAGLAFNATLMPVKVCTADGFCATSDIIAGLNRARTAGARVINLSLGSYDFSSAEAAAVASAIASGVVVVAAMGNDGNTMVNYPAAYPNVIAVGATCWDNTRASYSNTGSHIWLVAPGGCGSDQNGDGLVDYIFQQMPTQQRSPFAPCYSQTVPFAYCGLMGTSMATPHVSAVVALLRARNPALTVMQVRTILQISALDLGAAGFDTNYGYGLVQAFAALTTAVSCATSGAPAASPTPMPFRVAVPVVFQHCAGGW